MYLTTTCINRFRKYRIILYEISTDNDVVEWEYYWFILLRNNLYVGHILVAANRLSAFYFTSPNAFARFWQHRTVFFLFALGYGVTIGMRAVTLASLPNISFPTTVDNKTDIFGFSPDQTIDKMDALTEIVISLGTTSACIVLYIVTGMEARKKLTLLVERNKKREAVLLKCAIATFVMLIPPACRSTLHIIAMVSQNSDLQLWTARQQSMTTEAMFVFQPLLLLISCPQLREQAWDFLFPQPKTIVSSFSTTQAQSSSDNRW